MTEHGRRSGWTSVGPPARGGGAAVPTLRTVRMFGPVSVEYCTIHLSLFSALSWRRKKRGGIRQICPITFLLPILKPFSMFPASDIPPSSLVNSNPAHYLFADEGETKKKEEGAGKGDCGGFVNLPTRSGDKEEEEDGEKEKRG